MLAANGGGLDKLDFQKLLFLFTQTFELEPSYEFVPFKKGCYSFTSVAIGSNMFEGFVPTAKSLQIIRNYLTGEITVKQFMQMSRDKAYE